MAKKKIILFGNSSWYFFNFRYHLLRDLSKIHNLILVTPDDKYIKNFKFNLKSISLNYRINNKINIFEPFIIISKILYILIKFKPDMLINYTVKCNFYGLLIGKLFNIKIISNITGLGYSHLSQNFILKIINKFYLLLLKNSNLIIVQNKYDYDFFLKKLRIKSLKIIESSGIEIKKDNLNQNLFNKNKKFLMISRILKEKGINEYLEAAKSVKEINPKVKFYLYGQGNNDTLQAKVQKYHNNKVIIYKNFSNEIYSIIKKMDCIVLPSYREGSSKTLLEAALLRKPILASDVPGCNNIAINNFNAILFKPKNIESLVKAINKFLKLDTAKLSNMGANGRTHIINKFDVNYINMETLYQIDKVLN
tara:strand:- start:2150 stop:3244 length:1095 start_codon:yes stop_codon:yes gene_type:complete